MRRRRGNACPNVCHVGQPARTGTRPLRRRLGSACRAVHSPAACLADRDDLTQRVLAILVERLPAFEHNGRPGAFRAWLRGITVNLLHEHWRSRPAPAADSVLAQLADPAGGLSRLWEEQHDRHVLHELMEQVRPEFTPPTWRAFQRVALDGVPARVAAEELGLSVNAVL